MTRDDSRKLADIAPELERILTRGDLAPARFEAADIRRSTVWVTMRDGIRLATDIYLPPVSSAPTIAMRTPYDRANPKLLDTFVALAERGYVVVSQDCRGTGASEPDAWDYYVFEREDSFDFVEWVTGQSWFDGFVGAFGGSYGAQTQWCMATHPRMSAVVPEVGGLGIAFRTARLYMFLNAYARTIGKGADKVSTPLETLEGEMLEETLAGGYFNEPLFQRLPEALLRRYPDLGALPPSQARQGLWEEYCALGPAERAELIKQISGDENVTAVAIEESPAVFGHRISHDAHTIPHTDPPALSRLIQAPALFVTGWYDWGLDDALATWSLLISEANEPVRSHSRLIIAPSAHNMPGYHEGKETSPELERNYRSANIADLLLHWYAAVRDNTIAAWPRAIYYLMGANEWRAATAWPPPDAEPLSLYLRSHGALALEPAPENSAPDSYVYDPKDPTPTLGGSIVSHVYPPGSVDVSEVQKRGDVLTYTTPMLEQDLDAVGPLRMVLYASSSAVDTDFSVRLSDVFPDGRAIQLQSGMLRARYRGVDPELLEPGRIYCFEIDMWATANRFKAGHRLRVDISSADFPRFDRNANRGGELGPPVSAVQTVFHDREHPSHLLLTVLKRGR